MQNTELMGLPRCPTHNTPMHYRVPRTLEQRFCGTWYDCDTPGCACSVLLPSKELQAQLSAQQQNRRDMK